MFNKNVGKIKKNYFKKYHFLRFFLTYIYVRQLRQNQYTKGDIIMKRNIITVLLITAMISTMTACGKNNTDATTETAVTATEETITTEVATQDQIATLPLTDEDNPVVDATPSPDPKASDAPKTTADPKASTKPVVTETAKPNTQASATTTATAKPNATTAPKSTTAPAATATPKATQAPAATAKPVANTPAPTAAPVACQHTNTHIENAHDTYQVPISGGCYEEWETVTRVCNDCGANLGESKNRVGDVHHGCVITEGVSATCTTDGRTPVCGCDCGGLGTTGGEVIPAFGHDYKDVCTGEVSEDLMTVKYESVCRNCGDVANTWWE